MVVRLKILSFYLLISIGLYSFGQPRESLFKYGYSSTDDTPCDGIPCNDGGYSCGSPILIDLERDGFAFGGEESALYFDLYGNGDPLYIQWVLPGENDAFLFHDIDGNGLVANGSELFGNGTRLHLEENALADNGFIGLAQFDDTRLGGNNDGLITSEDQVWPSLYLWVDFNADGVSTLSEVYDLSSFNIMGLETIPRDTTQQDQHGNWMRFWARSYIFTTRGSHMKMVDVFFRILENP